MNVHLDTIGCRLNEAELQSWARAFTRAGHRIVPTPLDAQLLVLNTCAVTGEAERKSRQFVRRAHRQNPSARIVVTGCYAELAPGPVAGLPGVDLVVGNRDKDALVDRVRAALDLTTMPEIATDPEGAHVYPAHRTRAFVKVQDGCRHRCTFCIVTVARGEERSRAIGELVTEVNELHQSGYQEAVLTGVHLGGYGTELGTDLRTLVDALLRDTDVPRIRLSSLEPWDLPNDFWELWANRRLMPHLHLPLQSGCDTVLRRMGRRCTVAHFRDLVHDARAAIDDVTVTTDIIVGFPGETDAEWRAGLETMEAVGFGHVHAFTYSPREGTAAARQSGQVAGEVKRERAQALHELAARMKATHLEQFVGQTRDVLWEAPTPTAPDTGTPISWAGYTDNYLRVEIRTDAGADLENRIVPCVLTERQADRLLVRSVEAPARV